MDTTENGIGGSEQDRTAVGAGGSGISERIAPQGPPGIDEGLSKNSESVGGGDPGRPLRGGAPDDDRDDDPPARVPRLGGGPRVGPTRGARRTVRLEDLEEQRHFTPQQRLLLLDAWMRSKLPATEFASLVGVTSTTLYQWRKRFESSGPAGLSDRIGGRRMGSQMPEPTRRAILMLKEAHPDWGQDRLHDVLLRSEGYGASPGAIARVLEEEGYVVEAPAPAPHEPKEVRFERKTPNVLWQTDLFTFLLKRENRRVHLVAFMDDYSRFIVGYGLHASASGAMVREVLEAAIANFGAPKEVLTDNGSQYHTWRGTSAFRRLLDRRGIRQIVAAPRHPQTLGKAERFWGTLWREFLERAIFQGLEDARRRIGLFIDYYNFQRPHQGIEGAVPADRFFEAAEEVKEALKARVAANAEELARNGVPRKPFYLTGRVGDRQISLHAEGEKVVLVEGEKREEVDLSAPGRRAQAAGEGELPTPVAVTAVVDDAADLDDEDEGARAPGTSPLDEVVKDLAREIKPGSQDEKAPPEATAGGAS
jgi:transposase InsO family protein